MDGTADLDAVCLTKMRQNQKHSPCYFILGDKLAVKQLTVRLQSSGTGTCMTENKHLFGALPPMGQMGRVCSERLA